MLASGDKDAQKQALTAANKGWDTPPSAPSIPKAPASGGFNSLPSGFAASSAGFGTPMGGTTSPGFGAVPPAAVGMSSTGKTMPVQPEHPEI